MNPEPAQDDWNPGGSSSPSRSVFVPLLIAALTALVFWGISIGWLLIPHRGAGPPPVADRQLQVAPTGDEALARAMKAWEEFVEAEDFARRLSLVLEPARVGPLMRDYHERRGNPWPSMDSRSAPSEIRRNQQPAVVFEVEAFSGRRYPVAMVWDGRRFVVDWESLTAYGTAEWSELLESPPPGPQVLRVYLAELAPQRQPPPSVAGGRSFVRMEHRDSPTSTTLAVPPLLAPEVLRDIEGRRVPVIVEIAWLPELDAYELRRIVARGWNSPT